MYMGPMLIKYVHGAIVNQKISNLRLLGKGRKKRMKNINDCDIE